MSTLAKLPQGRSARVALAAMVLLTGLLAGCALGASAVEGIRWLSTSEPLLSNA